MTSKQALESIKQRFGIIGNAPALNHAIEIAMQIAVTDMGVLIAGEHGSGKESFAKIIHYLSPRKHGKFIAINCGAIPEGTIDSELFGHEKGAFTSASEARKGYFEEADQGTIFLDEIGEMPLHTQPRLLRVLENKEYMRVGSSKKSYTDTRVVAATNRDLQKDVAQGKFREDLYYRIAQVRISIPPLRERSEDIFLLFRKFALDFAQAHRAPLIQLAPEAKVLLMDYAFPGNVRQLKNITWQVATLESKHTVITKDILAPYLPKPIRKAGLPVPTSQQAPWATEREVIYKALFELQREISELKQRLGELYISAGAQRLKDYAKWDAEAHEPLPEEARQPLQPGSSSVLALPSGEKPTDLSLKEHEKQHIAAALTYGYKEEKTYREIAEILGISQRTLYRKMSEYNLKTKRKVLQGG